MEVWGLRWRLEQNVEWMVPNRKCRAYAYVMPRFINPSRLNPHHLLASTLYRSRFAMKNAYLEAVRASDRCNDLMREMRFRRSSKSLPQIFRDFGSIDGLEIEPDGYADRSVADAQAEDIQCDQQSTLLILFADDALSRYASMLLGSGPSLDPNAGREYGSTYNGVRLTSLLRAGTNAVRHCSEWDERFRTLPYPDINDPRIKKGSADRRALQSIMIIQKAFGLGINELIRDVVSWRIVVTLDGQYGSPGIPPDYERFEKAIILGARDIASSHSPCAAQALEHELAKALDSRAN